jgi:hypothetical protein
MATKLGAHVLRTCEDLGDYVSARPAVVKLVGDWGLSQFVPKGVLVIGRKFQGTDAQRQKARGNTPREAAENFVSWQVDTYRSNPLIKYWEGHNEPVWSSEEEMEWYAQFEIERMRIMAGMGLKCVIGNFASGAPDLSLWPAFLPAAEEGVRKGALLGLHEYSCPWMWWMTGNHQIDPEEDQGDEGWTTLRYRKIYRQHLEPAGLGNLPLVITECGIDPLVNPKPKGCEGGTWQQLGNYWREHDGETDKADFYFRQLVWYDEELQKDECVVGATVFTWGSYGSVWDRFDVAGTDVAEKLTEYTRENPARPFDYSAVPIVQPPAKKPDAETLPPTPEEPPVSTPGHRGSPRIQYERTYVLLSPRARAPWAHAVAHALWDERRYTIGGSADDAGIGDLDVRRVVAVNPEQWIGRRDLKDFFQEFYPGVEYVAISAATPGELEQKLSDL